MDYETHRAMEDAAEMEQLLEKRDAGTITAEEEQRLDLLVRRNVQRQKAHGISAAVALAVVAIVLLWWFSAWN